MADVTLDEIKKMVALQLGKHNVNDADRLVEDLGAESADVANLIAAVESKFGIHIKESEIARIITPMDVYKLVLRKTQ